MVGYAPHQVLHLWIGLGAGVGAGFYLGRETTEAERDRGPATLALSADRILDLAGGYAGALAALHTHLHLVPGVLPFL